MKISTYMRHSTLTFLPFLVLFFFATRTQGADFNVSDIDQLYSAVQQANVNGEDDLIHIAAGHYVLSGASNEDDAMEGDLDVKSNIIFQGAGARETVIDGNQIDRVFDILGSPHVEFRDLTIQKGKLTNGISDGDGAGISNESGIISVVNCSILNNINESDPNSYNTGGGIFNQNGSLNIENSTIAGNTCNPSGGGIGSLNSEIIINNSTISKNNGGHGGGIFIVNFTNGTATILNSTITLNQATFGGGIYVDDPIEVGNSIIANNQVVSTEHSDDYGGGEVLSLGYNIFGYENPLLTKSSTDHLGTLENPLDPLLESLQDNGGATDTHALLSNSPALDAGDPEHCPASDQRGVARPQGKACDIGAFEATATDLDNGGSDGGDNNNSNGQQDGSAEAGGGCSLTAVSPALSPMYLFGALFLLTLRFFIPKK